MPSKKKLEKIAGLIVKAKNILFFTHTDPDGDGLSAGLALKMAAESLGKSCEFIIDSPLPDKCLFLEGADSLKEYKGLDPLSFFEGISDTKELELGLIQDAATPARIGKTSDFLPFCKNIAVLDHHIIKNTDFENSYIDPHAASTGEIVYDLLHILEDMTGAKLFTKPLAKNLLTSIYFDTGGLRYSNTTPKAFRVAHDLFENFRPDLRSITYNLFEKTSKAKICIRSKVLNNLEYLCEGGLAIGLAPQKTMEECEVGLGDLDDLCAEIRSIEGVNLAILIRENQKDRIKVNIRSFDGVDAAELASSFGGGGHRRAAGFSLNDLSFEEAYELVKKAALDRYPD